MIFTSILASLLLSTPAHAAVRSAGTPGELESQPSQITERVSAVWLGSPARGSRETCFRVRVISAQYDHAQFPFWSAHVEASGRAIALRPKKAFDRPRSLPSEETEAPQFGNEMEACAVLPRDAVNVRLLLKPRFVTADAPLVLAWQNVPSSSETAE